MACDFCGRAASALDSVSDTLARYLPERFKVMCPGCERELNAKLDELRSRVWLDLARYALEKFGHRVRCMDCIWLRTCTLCLAPEGNAEGKCRTYKRTWWKFWRPI